MWKTLFKPEVLFLLGALQAVIPYLIFVGSGIYDGRKPDVLYGPVIIWILGYVSFWLGARIVTRKITSRNFFPITFSLSTIKLFLIAMSLFCLMEIYGASRVYGGLPIFAFLSGTLEVSDSNLAEAQSGFGQLGLLLLTLMLMTALVVIMILKAKQRNKSVAIWCIGGLLLVFFGDVINGKRQGILMTLMFIASCSTCAFGSPAKVLELLFPWKMTKTRRLLLAAAGFCVIVQLIGGLGAIRSSRNQGVSGIDTLLLYYGYPVMNIEEECRVANGLGPMEFKPFGIFYTLLPAKSSLRNSFLFGADPPRIELTSPSGFYERILWDTGIPGVILFSFCAGMLSRYIYQRAFRRHWALLTYGLIAWVLFSAPIYNHFLNLLYFPLPALIFWGISAMERSFFKVSPSARLSLDRAL